MAEKDRSASQKDEPGKPSQESESKPEKTQGPNQEKSLGPDKKAEQQPKKQPEKTPLYKRRGFIPVVVIIAVVLIVALVIIWFVLRQYVYTDDAYIDGHVTQISARVASQVLAVRVADNQLVHKGQLLIELDPTTFQVALDQAKANAGLFQPSQGQIEQRFSAHQSHAQSRRKRGHFRGHYAANAPQSGPSGLLGLSYHLRFTDV